MDRKPEFTEEITLHDLGETNALGARIAACLVAGDAVALHGDLGAGKTSLARAILIALGVQETIPSPTFTLVQRYELPEFVVSHFDLYRIEREEDMDELGLEDALVDGAVLIEWPERAGDRLPDDALHVQLTIAPDASRNARLSGPARWASLARTEAKA